MFCTVRIDKVYCIDKLNFDVLFRKSLPYENSTCQWKREGNYPAWGMEIDRYYEQL